MPNTCALDSGEITNNESLEKVAAVHYETSNDSSVTTPTPSV